MSDITKLPKWAQDHIQTLQRQRDTAVEALRDWTDQQTEQPISISELVCLTGGGPTHLTRHIKGDHLTITWKGVELSVHLKEKGRANDSAIDLKWGSPNRLSNQIAMVPTSFQAVSLIAKENMR